MREHGRNTTFKAFFGKKTTVRFFSGPYRNSKTAQPVDASGIASYRALWLSSEQAFVQQWAVQLMMMLISRKKTHLLLSNMSNKYGSMFTAAYPRR